MPTTAPRAVVVTERAVGLLSKPPGLTGAPGLLLWHLARSLPVKGDILSVTDLAEQLGLSRVHLSKAMKELLRAGFIVRGVKIGRLYHYQLNPAYFHLL